MATSYTQEIGGLVRKFREEQGLSGRALAIKADISQPYLWQIEDGQVDVPASTIKEIADALGISPHDLIPTPKRRRA